MHASPGGLRRLQQVHLHEDLQLQPEPLDPPLSLQGDEKILVSGMPDPTCDLQAQHPWSIHAMSTSNKWDREATTQLQSIKNQPTMYATYIQKSDMSVLHI